MPELHRAKSHRQKVSLTHEQHLMLHAIKVLGGFPDTANELRHLADHELSPHAGPSWHLLRGACAAVSRAGSNHPLRRDLRMVLERAIVLAREEGLPPRPVVFTGGVRPYFEKDA